MSEDKQTPSLSAVLYTDGSASPNPGFGGWGIHGYTYNPEVIFTPAKTQKKNIPSVKGYLDEAFLNEEVLPVKKLHTINAYGTAKTPTTTNNVMELFAVERAARLAKEQQWRRLHILTDSQFALIALGERYEWWKKNNWLNSSGEPLKLKNEIISMREAWDELGNTCQLSAEYIKGHKGFIGNEFADKLANKGSTLRKHGKVLEEIDLGIEPLPPVVYHDFFTTNRWYFVGSQTVKTHQIDGWHVYLCGSHGAGRKDLDVGCKSPDGCLSLVVLKEPEAILEKVQSMYSEVCQSDYEFVVCGRLDTILNPNCFADLWEKKIDLICHDKAKKTLSLPNGKVVCMEYNPAHLSIIHMSRYLPLIEIMEMHMGKKDSTLTYTDILEQISEKEVSKKGKVSYKTLQTLAKNDVIKLPVQYKSESGDIKSTQKKITIGIDLPTKLQLNRLLKNHAEDITIQLVTRRMGPKVHEVYCLISTGGCYGLWTNPFSSVIYEDE